MWSPHRLPLSCGTSSWTTSATGHRRATGTRVGLDVVALRPGEPRLHTTDGVTLGNGGGTITLLDTQGLEVDGVSYTAEQADDEGWALVF
jgi:hypothetical protein